MKRACVLLAVAAAGLLLGACAHQQKTARVQAPYPPLPPGVTWGQAADLPPVPHRTHLPNHAPAPHNVSSVEAQGRLPRVGEVWQEGLASYYGPEEQGRATASGEPFDYHKRTAAHRLLPLGTIVEVTDLRTGQTVEVRINDRGPFWPSRVLDLSVQAAKDIGLYRAGVERVRIKIVSLPDPLPAGRYTVQVGWFVDNDSLDRCKTLMQERIPKRVIEFNSSSGHWLRYASTVSLDQPTAERLVAELQRDKFPAYTVRLN